MANDITDKPKNVKTKYWLHSHRYLIGLIEKYPVTYYPFNHKRPTKPIKAKWDDAWVEIGKELSQPSKKCKYIWSDIKYRYVKLMKLISSGKITKEAAKSNPETAKFFDGLLTFMDPYVKDIKDEDIPLRIHRCYNELFGVQTKRTCDTQKKFIFYRHAQVKALIAERELAEGPTLECRDTQYLQCIVDSAIKRKLEDLLSTNKTPSVNSPLPIPSNNNESFNVPAPMANIPDTNASLGLQTELIIEDDIKEEPEVDDIEEDMIIDKNTQTDIAPKTQIVIPTENNDAIIVEYSSDIAMTGNNDEPVSDEYVKKFFAELGEVMSVELSLPKQCILRSRINNLLRHLLIH